MNARTGGDGVRTRLIRGVKWTMLQSLFVAASHFAIAVVVARLLGVDNFGAFSIIRVTGFSTATMAGAGLGSTATKYIAELRSQDPQRLGQVVGLCSAVAAAASLGFAGIVFWFAPEISANFLNAAHIATELRIAAAFILFVTLNGYQIGAMVGFEAFSILAKINVVQALFSLAITYLFTLTWGLTGAVSSLVISAFTNWLLHQLAIRRELKKNGIAIQYSRIWQEKHVLTDFTFPAALSSIIGAITVWSCNAFLVRQAGGLVQLGIFSAANNFRSLILFVPGLVTQVVSPILCNLMGKNNQSGYSRLFWTNIAISAVAATTVAFGLVFAAPHILKLFGRGFGSGDSVAMVIVTMAVIEVMANAFYNSLFAHGKLWWQFRVVVCWSLALGAVTILTVEQYGAMGLAYAYLMAHLVSLTMYVAITYRIRQNQKKECDWDGSVQISE